MVEEQSTDGRTGIDAAKKFLAGDLPTSKTDGYNGAKAPNGSLINGAEKKSSEEEMEEK